MEQPLLSFKAGRSYRRGTTNFIDPAPEKGLIEMRVGVDELLHFHWVNRDTNESEVDLILFPMDATVKLLPHGRIMLLKFESSNERHFFWLQDADTNSDDNNIKNLNGLLADPSYEVSTPVPVTSAQPSSAPTLSPATGQPTPSQLAHLRNLIQNIPSLGSTHSAPTVSLIDILTPTLLLPVLSSSPEILQAIFPNLPPDLPLPPSPDVLRRIIESTQFQASVRGLDRALRTGLLGGLVVGLGLPAEAGLGVEPFLKAIGEQAKKQQKDEGRSGSGGGDEMQTD